MMNPLDWNTLLRLLPEILAGLTLFSVVGVDRGLISHWGEQARFTVSRLFACGALAACALVSLAEIPFGSSVGLAGAAVFDPLSSFAQAAIFLLASGSLWLTSPEDAGEHPAEFFALGIASALGLSLMASARDLILLFISVELSGLSLYALCAFHKKSAASAEAALKYFTIGAVASAFTLYGFGILMSQAGGTRFDEIAVGLFSHPPTLWTLVGVIFSLGGMAFKITAAPMHMAAPDVYRHAPLPVASMIATASKVGAAMALIRLVGHALSPDVPLGGWHAVQDFWVITAGWLAAVSMVLGNLGALAQQGFRRLIAYSGVAHAGYMLVALFSCTPQGYACLLFYSVIYAAANLGLFALIAGRDESEGDSLRRWQGLATHSPAAAIALGVFILSLAGLPPTAGFAGKFFLFMSAAGGALGWMQATPLLAVGLLASCIGFYYYLRVLKYAFVHGVEEGEASMTVRVLPLVWISLAVVLVLGVAPNFLLAPMAQWAAGLFPSASL